MQNRIEKLRKRDSVISEINQRRDNRQKQIDMANARAIQIQRNNIRLVKKVFVDLYRPNYKQQELL